MSGSGSKSGRPNSRRASSGVQSTSIWNFIACLRPEKCRLAAGALPAAPLASRFHSKEARDRRAPHMAATNTTIPTLDGAGTIPAYVARPDADSARAIIVIPEIFGVNEGIRQQCDDWAAEGSLAIAPDIFWPFDPKSVV